MDYARPDRAEALAAEYVAGTLRGPARRRFESLLPSHPTLRAAVQSWEDRLMPLTGALPEVPPPPRVWRKLEQRLWPQAQTVREPWWRQLFVWRAASGTAFAAVLALALVMANPSPTQPPVVVVLQGTGDGGVAAGSAFVASVSGDGAALVTRPIMQVSAQANRAFELWSVPPQGAPKSLGLIKADGVTLLDRKKLPASLLRGGTAALAVSLEPPGGSPTGAPTGPVVYAGKLQL